MKIDSVDLFYLRMPEVEDIGDGSQDALLIRVRAGKWTGWGECEASPLTSIASFVAPMSHSACKPLAASVLGERLETPDDIRRIHRQVRENSLDLLQADHTLSGIDMALWDLLGRKFETPVYRLLGYEVSFPKVPYASVLFGATPQATQAKAAAIRAQGYRAAKFGWGPFGRGTLDADEAQLEAARYGLGEAADLMVDAGTVWGENVEAAAARLPTLERVRACWLEEPFPGECLAEYHALSRRTRMPLAGGEGSHSAGQARQMIDYGGVGYIQIDAGRVGGISSCYQAAQYAATKGVTYVNHTFTSSLALSASLQPYAGLEAHRICEFPAEPKPLARDLTTQRLLPSPDGLLRAPEAPGLGLEPDLAVVAAYLVEVEIKVAGSLLFRSDLSLLHQ